jgi:hypothetical protein
MAVAALVAGRIILANEARRQARLDAARHGGLAVPVGGPVPAIQAKGAAIPAADCSVLVP